MRKVREVLRLTDAGRSQREVAASLAIATGTVAGYLQRAREAGLTWERAETMSDEAVETTLFRYVGHNLPAARAVTLPATGCRKRRRLTCLPRSRAGEAEHGQGGRHARGTRAGGGSKGGVMASAQRREPEFKGK